jgi:hypothetical protein
MMLRQLGHGHHVLLNHLRCGGARVSRNVIDAGQQNHGSGLEVDHIGIHPNQHLRSGLAADPAIYVRLPRKVLVELPEIRNGISQENHAVCVERLPLQFLVRHMIPAELVPILKLIRKALGAVHQTAIRSRRAELARQLGMGDSDRQQGAEDQCAYPALLWV